MNKVLLIGTIAAEPNVADCELTGQEMATLPLAIERHWYKKDGELVTSVDYFKLVFYPKFEIGGKQRLPKDVLDLRKGETITVDGSLRNVSYETEDGRRAYRTEVVVDYIGSVTQKQ